MKFPLGDDSFGAPVSQEPDPFASDVRRLFEFVLFFFILRLSLRFFLSLSIPAIMSMLVH